MEETMDTTEGVTETQAGGMWCPQARNQGIYMGNGGATCCASACMVWRWLGYSDTLGDKNKGCCGLAGKP